MKEAILLKREQPGPSDSESGLSLLSLLVLFTVSRNLLGSSIVVVAWPRFSESGLSLLSLVLFTVSRNLGSSMVVVASLA